MLKQGFAKKCFKEAFQRTPWLAHPLAKPSSRWPLVEQLMLEQRLSYFDYILTEKLLCPFPNAGQETALFLCHLSLAASKGHLCVRIDRGKVEPSVFQLWTSEEAGALAHEEAAALTRFILQGAKTIPEGLCTAIEADIPSLPATPLCREGLDYYLQRHWMLETSFLCALKAHLQHPPALNIDENALAYTVQNYIHQKALLPEQGEAIIQGCKQTLTLVTGGPGTGKTYTAGYLIKTFWDHLSEEQRKNCRIVLAAPTGKAAANLQQSLGKIAANLDRFPPLQAKTLHQLLDIKQHSSHGTSVYLSADLIVVDESSMIDIRMMAYLFEALKSGSRLIMLGDEHQLPSVEAGSIFLDLVQAKSADPALPFSSIRLSTPLRAEIDSLIDFATLVNQGNGEEVVAFLNQSNRPGVYRQPLPTETKKSQNELLNHAVRHFPSHIKGNETPEEILNRCNAVRFLSPLRKGPFGFDTLNQLIAQSISGAAPGQGWLPIPIMILTNDYRLELFNGETGLLMRKLPLLPLNQEDYALFPSRTPGAPPRRFSTIALPNYDYAYCLSIHKSQGSEFDCVLLILPDGSDIFGREVFYTAVTRARKTLEIFGSDEAIKKTVEQRGFRLSGIQKRLGKNPNMR